MVLARDLQLLDANVYTELETGYESASKMPNELIRALKVKEDRRIKGQGPSSLKDVALRLSPNPYFQGGR